MNIFKVETTVNEEVQEPVEVEAWNPLTAARRSAKELKDKMKLAMKIGGVIVTKITRIK